MKIIRQLQNIVTVQKWRPNGSAWLAIVFRKDEMMIGFLFSDHGAVLRGLQPDE